ncbi:MAG: hypothetical protein MJ105_02535 [Lachnospiraceae bacterium]|nr:hypothetical protein [Lachnospiraceae bacterium]
MASPIMDIKNELFKAEYALVEEQFRYDSIPRRKSFTESKLRLKIFFFVPIFAALVFFVIRFVQQFPSWNKTPETRLQFVFTIFATAIFAGFTIWLITQIRKDVGLLYGTSSKHATGGYRNYKDEERHTKDRIIVLQDEILRLKKEIIKLKEARSYQEVQKEREYKNNSQEKDPSEMTEEEFFYYALGTWAEDRATVTIKYKHGAYDKEKEDLESRIKELNKTIMSIDHERERIDMHYKKMEGIFIYFLFGFCIIILFQYIMGGDNAVITYICAGLGIVNLIASTYFFFTRYKDAHLRYCVEHKYHKVKYFAEENNIIPTKQQKQEVYYQIKNCQRKLAYVEQVLAFPFENM